MKKSVLLSIKYKLEYAVFLFLCSMIRLVSLDKASYICGKILRFIGPYLKVTKIAKKNIRIVYPTITEKKEEKLIKNIWQNFGQFLGEFAHIHYLNKKEIERRVKIEGMENLPNKPFILLTGHFSNWEFVLMLMTKLYPKFAVMYRKANNPIVNARLNTLRKMSGCELIEKFTDMKKLFRVVKENYAICILADQKMNDGIESIFFGKKAMSTDSVSRISFKFNYPIIPVQIIRTKGVNFRVVIHPEIKELGNIEDDTRKINKIFERWILEFPDQWFWFHNRW